MARRATPTVQTSLAHSDRHFYTDKRVFGRFGMRIFTPSLMEKAHWHGHVEANWLTSGQMHYLVDGVHKIIPSNHLVVFWAGVPHQLTKVDGTDDPEQKLCNIYLPLDAFLFMPHLAKLRASGREIVICGDWNIAHREIDLKNWRGNQKNSGFLPEERAWLGKVFDEQGWVDVYRRLHPDTTGEAYTWWSNRGQAWAKNVGWRIDYQIATPGIAAKAKNASVYKAQRFSDHAPLTIDYGWPKS